MFIYFAKYIVPSRAGLYGQLEDIPIPLINSLDWEIPDNTTILCFKTKLSQDIQKAMTPGRISRRIRISWFVPLHVFVACFRSIVLQRTKTMWLNRRLHEEDLDCVLGDMWKTKESFHLGDTIRCKASPNSLAISYQIARQSLVIGYDYRRWRQHLGSWIPLDSEVDCPEFEVEIIGSAFQEPRNLVVNSSWTLKDIRESLEFLDCINTSYRFKINGIPIGKRVEKITSCTKCMAPHIVAFEPL